ncbi:hypothetical protein Droror1_Dr00006402 [Drosera rotundifolia]
MATTNTTETPLGSTIGPAVPPNTATSSLPIVKTISQEISFKLATTNYLIWKMQVMPVLRCHGLLGLVDGTIPRPDDSTAAADIASWLRLDQMVLAWIASSLSEDVFLQVIHCTTAREIWLTLDTLYATIADFERRLQTNRTAALPTVALLAFSNNPQPHDSFNQTPGRGGIPFGRGGVSSGRRGGRGRGSSFCSGRNPPRAAPVTGDSNSVYCYKCGYPNHKANACEASFSTASSHAPSPQAFAALQISDPSDSSCPLFLVPDRHCPRFRHSKFHKTKHFDKRSTSLPQLPCHRRRRALSFPLQCPRSLCFQIRPFPQLFINDVLGLAHQLRPLLQLNLLLQMSLPPMLQPRRCLLLCQLSPLNRSIQ